MTAPQGQLIITNSASAPFPHPQRANGHTYRGELFAASQHHSDLGHDGVLFERRQFCAFLRASVLEPIDSAKTLSPGR